MNRRLDSEYLKTEQYRTGCNLTARIELHERFSTHPVPLPRWIFDQFRLPPTARVLEVGCGTGELWVKNAARIPVGWKLTLTDFSEGMLAEARTRLKNLGRTMDFRCADVQALPFPDQSFDGVVANYMLFHVPDLPAALAELARVLVPTGRFYAATNGAGHLKELDQLIGKFRSVEEAEHADFTCENGEELLRSRFGRVTFSPYPDSLEITDASAVLRYVLSVLPKASATAEVVRGLTEEIDRRFESGGGRLRVTQNTGLFEAADPRPS